MSSDSALTPQEREWSFALEEALYGTDETTRRRGARRRRPPNRTSTTGTSSGMGIGMGMGMGSPHPDPSRKHYQDMPTDFELATHAMIGKENTARSLKRIRRLANFKETYRVPGFHCDLDDDEEDLETAIGAVLLVLKKFFLAYPDVVKSIGMDQHGRVAVVLRLRALRWSQAPPFNHTESDRLRALYCLLTALQPTVESVRRGTVWIVDLGGVTDQPDAEFLAGCRKLFRDSYPMRVQDVPVVRCPPLWSGAFVATRPFWSRHFGARFVRVDAETLRQHFPPALLARKRKHHGPHPPSGMPRHRKQAIRNRHPRRVGNRNYSNNHNNKTQRKAAVVKASNGDEYDNKWETLDEDDSENDGDEPGEYYDYEDLEESHSEWSDWTSVASPGGADAEAETEAAIGKQRVNDEVWTKIERLVRMRFETERTFRVV